ncbi:Protein of unknown function [Gryllus bimaculatus]|nr:Protein of unknown function [Gryllus bimaculatus]
MEETDNCQTIIRRELPEAPGECTREGQWLMLCRSKAADDGLTGSILETASYSSKRLDLLHISPIHFKLLYESDELAQVQISSTCSNLVPSMLIFSADLLAINLVLLMSLTGSDLAQWVSLSQREDKSISNVAYKGRNPKGRKWNGVVGEISVDLMTQQRFSHYRCNPQHSREALVAERFRARRDDQEKPTGMG